MEHVKEVIVVEGKYDKNALLQVVDATVICTDGFQIFRDAEKQALLRRLARERGLILLTDPDGAGRLLRGFLSGIVDRASVKQAYVPDVFGKEKRKSSPSKEGKLGVEGMRPQILLDALRRAGATMDRQSAQRIGGITKADFYRLGLSGGSDSAARRKALQRRLELPERMSANQLLEVLNVISDREELERLMSDPTGLQAR